MIRIVAFAIPFVLATVIAVYLEFVVKRSRMYLQLVVGVSSAIVVAIISFFKPEVDYISSSELGETGICLSTIAIGFTLLVTTVVTVLAKSDRIPRGIRVTLATAIGGVPLLLGTGITTVG